MRARPEKATLTVSWETRLEGCSRPLVPSSHKMPLTWPAVCCKSKARLYKFQMSSTAATVTFDQRRNVAYTRGACALFALRQICTVGACKLSDRQAVQPLQEFHKLFTAIQADKYASEERKVTVFVSTLEADSVCALRILQVTVELVAIASPSAVN